MAENAEAEKPAVLRAGGAQPLFSVLIFGFGTAAGLLLAFAAAGFVENSGGIIITVFLSALIVIGTLGLLLFLFRRLLLQRLFGVAETQVELFADPMARAATGALDGDSAAAVAAARDLVALGLARYAWLAARRWVIASLTALIAAMAALAGTALLFKQNTLLEAQTVLLGRQNDKIEAQTVLLQQDVQLAEAARNAAIAVALTDIAASVGAVADRTSGALASGLAASGQGQSPLDAMVNVIDPLTDLDHSLMLRIVSLSRAARPYRFLDTGLLPDDPNDRLRVAMQARRNDLPQAWARMADAYGWGEPLEGNRLIDRPSSPERGQLLQILLSGGVRDLAVLNHFGLDLSFADFQNGDVIMMNAMGGKFAYADFSGAQVRQSDLGGASFENARFRRADLRGTNFGAVTAERLRPPYPESGLPYATFLSGADFSGAVIRDTGFAGATMLAAVLDDALLIGTDFSGATLAAAQFRRAVIVTANFDAADLKSADFDGAVVFGEAALDRIEAAAAPGRFRKDRFRAEPMTPAEVMSLRAVQINLSEAELAKLTGGAQAYRLVRTAAFEE